MLKSDRGDAPKGGPKYGKDPASRFPQTAERGKGRGIGPGAAYGGVTAPMPVDQPEPEITPRPRLTKPKRKGTPRA